MTEIVSDDITSLGSDAPKMKPEDDALGYAAFAGQIAKAIQTTPSPHGLVMAIHGPWGAGKSTLLNFVKHALSILPDKEKVLVVEFNPWWFNDKNHLAGQFLAKFQTALKLDPSQLRKVGDLMAQYNSAIAATAATSAGAPWAAKPIAWLLGLFRFKPADVADLKGKIEKALLESKRRVLFVIDDIDRLTPDEIRELFKVIKALADFPNVVYLLAFDRHVVHQALEKALGINGNSYLEKIVQVPFSLPAVDRFRLRRLFFSNMDTLLSVHPNNKFDSAYWQNVYSEGIDQFITKPRDIVRLTNAVFVSYPPVAGEVNFADFVALEALRIFEPGLYEVIRDNREMFAGYSSQNHDPNDLTRKFHEAWLAEVPAIRRDATKALISRVFPKAASSWGDTGHSSEFNEIWRAELRVCSPDLYDVFFQFGVPVDSLSRAELTQFVAAAENASDVETILRTANLIVRPDGTTKAGAYLERVRDSKEELSEAAAVGLLTALYNVGDEILKEDDGGRGMFSLPLHWWLLSTTEHLLQKIPAHDRWRVLRQLLANGAAIGLAVYTIDRIREHLDKTEDSPRAGLAAISGTEFEDLKGVVMDRLRRMPSADFLRLRDMAYVVYAWRRCGGDDPARVKIGPLFLQEELLPTLLDKFKQVRRSQVVGAAAITRHVTVNPTLIGDFVVPESIESTVSRMLARPDLTPDQRDAGNSFMRNIARLRNGESIDGFESD